MYIITIWKAFLIVDAAKSDRILHLAVQPKPLVAQMRFKPKLSSALWPRQDVHCNIKT